MNLNKKIRTMDRMKSKFVCILIFFMGVSKGIGFSQWETLSEWFGAFSPLEFPWLKHAEHGWLYAVNEAHGFFFYDSELRGWFWTSGTYYPWVHLYGQNAGWYRYAGIQGEDAGRERTWYRFLDRTRYTSSVLGSEMLPWSALDEFITRDGDRLMEGEREFRFLSFNIPNIHILEDPDPSWNRVDPWEQEDAVRTIHQLGGRVFRMYCFSVRGGVRNGMKGISHVYAPGVYDEVLFRDLDYLLYLCNLYGVRIIIPFIDNWEWFGGDKQFAAFYGKDEWMFYTDPEIKAGFKAFIADVINRTNTVTGVRYGDDPAILCWELGNELDQTTDSWISEMAAHIKSLAPNHLVMDGQHKPSVIRSVSLTDPNIDICTIHYQYDLSRYLGQTRGKKAFVLGEFILPISRFPNFLDEVIASGASGALMWSLRFRNKAGGFYFHGDGGDFGDSFQWPGFRNTEPTGEHLMLPLLRTKAYEIRGLDMPPMPIAEPPVVFAHERGEPLMWRGSTGAASYVVEVLESPDGSWLDLERGVLDSGRPFEGYLLPLSLPAGTHLRMRAVNSGGISKASNIIEVFP